MRIQRLRAAQALTAALIAVGVVTCGSDSGSTPTGPAAVVEHDSTFCQVTWNPEALYFDSTMASALLAVDSAGQVFTFDAASALADSLAPGKVFVVHGQYLRRVVDVTDSANVRLVTTEDAALTDAFTDADIYYNKEFAFDPQQIGSELAKAYGGMPIVNRDSLSLTLVIAPYTYTIFMKLKQDSAHIKMEIQKKIGAGVAGRFTCEGTLQKFRTRGLLKIANSQTTAYDFSNSHVTGDLTLSLTATASGNDALNYNFPVTLAAAPIMVGPVPVLVKIKVVFVINAQVPYDGSSQVSAGFHFDSDAGFSWNGSSVLVNGRAGNSTVVKNIAQTGASSAIGVNYGLAAPRIEASFYGMATGWVQTAFLIGGFYSSFPACQQATTSFIGAAGYSLGLFGISLAGGSQTLWQKNDTLLQAGSCQ